MLDIDLDLLKFIINPNMDYIKEDIKHLEQLYLQGLPEEEYKRKKEKYDQTIYIFLEDIELEVIFLNQLIEDIYMNFASFFSINLKENDENFISDILDLNNCIYFVDDCHLNILKNDIKNYLTNVMNTSDNNKDKSLAKQAIEYLNSLISKYDQIYEIIEPIIKEVEEFQNYKQQFKRTVLLKIMKTQRYLFNKKEKKIINESKNYDEILKLFQNKMKDYYEVNEYFNFYDENKFLINNLNKIKKIIDITIEHYHNYLKTKYNEYYNQLIYEKIYKKLKNNSKILNDFNDIIYEITHEVIEHAREQNLMFYYECTYKDKVLNIVFMNNLSIFLNKLDYKEFYISLCHELGHAQDSNTDFTPDLDFIYEIYVQYRAWKKLLNDNNKSFTQDIHFSDDCHHNNYIFMLIDIFEEYKNYFEDFCNTDNEQIIIDLLGIENIKKINDFNYEKAQKDYEYANEYLKFADNLLNEVRKKDKRNKYIKAKKKYDNEILRNGISIYK